MQEIDEIMKSYFDSFRQSLSKYFALPDEDCNRLIFGFEESLNALMVKLDKQYYLMFISNALNRLDKNEHYQNYLLSLATMDIHEEYLTYTTPIETDGQDQIFIFYIWCCGAISGMKSPTFSGVQFVHQYAIGSPTPVRLKLDSGHYTETTGDLENGQYVDLTKHFDSVLAIKVFETGETVRQNLWPLKVILRSAKYSKTIVLLSENDYVDIGYGKEIPCHKELAPLTIHLFPKEFNPEFKYYLNVVGKLMMGEARTAFLDKVSKKINYQEFGFHLDIF